MKEHQYFGLAALILLSPGVDDKVRTVLWVLCLSLQILFWVVGV